jgi:hypothetical protein
MAVRIAAYSKLPWLRDLHIGKLRNLYAPLCFGAALKRSLVDELLKHILHDIQDDVSRVIRDVKLLSVGCNATHWLWWLPSLRVVHLFDL